VREEPRGNGLGRCDWMERNLGIGIIVSDGPSHDDVVNWRDSVCVLKFSVGGDPLHVLLRENGSSDIVVDDSGEGISAYAEPIRFLAFLLDDPSRDRPIEVDRLEAWICEVDAGRVSMEERDDVECTRGEVGSHGVFDCGKRSRYEVDCGIRSFYCRRALALADDTLATIRTLRDFKRVVGASN
jgi:hypothetical protein